MINVDLLKNYGASEKKISKKEMLFQEGDSANFYYQIISGEMKMNNYDDNGNETIQGLFSEGQSFGEPAILGNFDYPANGEAITEVVLIRLSKDRFLLLLQEHPEISIEMLSILSKRLRFKAILSKEVKSYNAEHRILTLLKVLKENTDNSTEIEVKISRQTIANLTGLRVETVIRSIKQLEAEKKLKIKKSKIFF